MFLFFFKELYNLQAIHQAFKNICLDKMLIDGYIDMSTYIYARIKKENMRRSLAAAKSKYVVLYESAYPNSENAYAIWEKKININLNHDISDSIELTQDESSAIVNWVYRTLKDSEKRIDFTIELLKTTKKLHRIKQNIRLSKGVVYNSAKVEIHFLSSLSEVNHFLALEFLGKDKLFFRGHSNPNYILQPSIMRTSRLERNESKMYQELIINCPEDFSKCQTHLEKLVKMQHYGLPTRLLDITRNPLVALYFACENQPETYGELVLISTKEHEIKYPQSDTVSILASLPVFSYDMQRQFYKLVKDFTVDNEEFNRQVKRLVHEVRLEKPAFQPEIKKNDIINSYIVYAIKNNKRIVKQEGAFILCGLRGENNMLGKFKYKKHGKKVVLLIKNKHKILNELETFLINWATLFPEIECVSKYIKDKYSKS